MNGELFVRVIDGSRSVVRGMYVNQKTAKPAAC